MAAAQRHLVSQRDMHSLLLWTGVRGSWSHHLLLLPCHCLSALLSLSLSLSLWRLYAFFHTVYGGTAAAAPPPFRPSDPALCGSCPLVTPYWCRLGDLLCLFFVYPFVSTLLSVYCICVFSCFRCFLSLFVASPSVL